MRSLRLFFVPALFALAATTAGVASAQETSHVTIVGERSGFRPATILVRPGTTVQTLAGLQPSFYSDAMNERFPQINWSITAGRGSCAER